MNADRLWQCECGAYFSESALLKAQNPYDPEDELRFCPECKDVIGDPLRPICDEPGCTATVSGGGPSPSGYRWTCHEHRGPT
jgi:hypothetical protein